MNYNRTKGISLKDMQEELNKIGKKEKLFTLEDYINTLTEEEKEELGRRYRLDRKKRKLLEVLREVERYNKGETKLATYEEVFKDE